MSLTLINEAEVTRVTDFLGIYLASPKYQLTASQQDNVNSYYAER